MIITRTPLRISIGGGGTDLPSYYSKFGGFCISAAISQYVYITLHRTFKNNYIIKYSQYENVDRPQQIKHPIIREAFQLHKIDPYLEMVSMADIPAGTGLGSSGSFNVGLLKAIYTFKREIITTHDLAEEACRIEIDLLKEPIGKQDQYIAAFGGFIAMDIDKEGHVAVNRLQIKNEVINELGDNLLMFFTGYSRNAGTVLADQKNRTEKDDSKMLDNLHFIKELGHKIKDALESGNVEQFGMYMHEHWLHKKNRSSTISSPEINSWYDKAYANGALGGKLIGAGGGGFLLFYAKDRKKLRQAMAEEGLQEVRFSFDFEGSKVLVNE